MSRDTRYRLVPTTSAISMEFGYSELSDNHNTTTIIKSSNPNTSSNRQTITRFQLAAILTGCLLMAGSVLVTLVYLAGSPSSLLWLRQSKLSYALFSHVVRSNQSIQPSISPIHTFESYSEQPLGYWSDAGNNGTHFTGIGSEHDRYEPLVDLLIGEECGGFPGLDYMNLSSLDFLVNQTIFMIGDSTDRYMTHYLCGAVECGDRCPRPCQYTKNVLHAEFKHYPYPNITHTWQHLIGMSSCHIPILNFTLMNAMTYSILPDRYLTNTYFSYNFTAHSPFEGEYTYRHFINQFVKPFFQSNNESNPVSMLRRPSILTAQSGLWDLMLLVLEKGVGFRAAEMDLRSRWWNNLGNTMLPILDDVFHDAKLKYLRTIPPVKDYPNRLCADISAMMRSKIKHIRERDPNNKWRLWDIAVMLAECEEFEFDQHHYGPHVLYQLLNVLLNDVKARRSLLQ